MKNTKLGFLSLVMVLFFAGCGCCKKNGGGCKTKKPSSHKSENKSSTKKMKWCDSCGMSVSAGHKH